MQLFRQATIKMDMVVNVVIVIVALFVSRESHHNSHGRTVCFDVRTTDVFPSRKQPGSVIFSNFAAWKSEVARVKYFLSSLSSFTILIFDRDTYTLI